MSAWPDFPLSDVIHLATARLGEGAPRVERRLADLRGCFADAPAYEAALEEGNPLVYAVESREGACGEGGLHYGLGVIQPGKVGNEYFLTKGHLHAWREAAEVYVGLSGQGVMVLESEETGESRLEPLGAGRLVYVPGRVAHRTVNTGAEPLVYLGVYPACAGHDYGVLAERNFRLAVIDGGNGPCVVPRENILL